MPLAFTSQNQAGIRLSVPFISHAPYIVHNKVRHGLVRKGKLKARRDEETGRWLLDHHSVSDHLIASRVELQGVSSTFNTTVVVPDATQDVVRQHEVKGVRLPYMPGLDGP